MVSDWFIGVSCSEEDGVKIYRFYGTEAEVKEQLVAMVKADKEKSSDTFSCGTEVPEGIYEREDKSLFAVGSFTDQYIDYSAYRLCDLPFISAKP